MIVVSASDAIYLAYRIRQFRSNLKVIANCIIEINHLNRYDRKLNFEHVRPKKTQISLHIRAVSSVFYVARLE